MKPRLILLRKLWHCGLPQGPIGVGYSPAQAFDDWKARMKGYP